MDEKSAQPWHSKAGMLHGPQWSVADIMDKTYHARSVLPPSKRSKAAFYEYLNKSKRTFNEYLAAVGMQWQKGVGPPPDDRLVLILSASTHLLLWVSPSVCKIVGKPRDEILGHLASEVLREGLILHDKQAEFARIMLMLRTGDINVGQASTYILAQDGAELPLQLDITYGHGCDVLFVNGAINQAAQQIDLFNVEPLIVLPERRLRLDDQPHSRYSELTRWRSDSRAYVQLLERWAEGALGDDGTAAD